MSGRQVPVKDRMHHRLRRPQPGSRTGEHSEARTIEVAESGNEKIKQLLTEVATQEHDEHTDMMQH